MQLVVDKAYNAVEVLDGIDLVDLGFVLQCIEPCGARSAGNDDR